MRTDALTLEEQRLDRLDFETYPWLHERHRIFPEVLLDKPHGKMLDAAAGTSSFPSPIIAVFTTSCSVC